MNGLWLVAAAAAADLSALTPAALSAAICAETNRVRAFNGVPALPVRPPVTAAAQLHADQMVTHGFFGHTAPEGAPYRLPVDRMLGAGIDNPYPAENIATWYALQYEGGGYRVISAERAILRSEGRTLQAHTPESLAKGIVAYWMDSPPHRANMLSTRATEVGCAATVFRDGAFPMVKGVQLFQHFEPTATDGEG